jgi:hypothetical protein
MFGSEMLDIAIGMIFTYLLVSLICSAINELIERFFKNRATDLEKGLRELLDDEDGTGLVKEVYDHGMINGLFKGDYKPAPTADKSNLPSYIPARNFALAILGILMPNPPVPAPAAPGAAPAPGVSFRDAVSKIKSPKVKNALTAMLNVAGDDIDKFRANIEGWFNSTMDRVSGWYKRRSQLIVFLLGFAAAGVMNINSLSIANDLWVHKAERDAMVSAAQGYLVNHPLKEGEAPSSDSRLKANVESIESYGLPIGWNVGTVKNLHSGKPPCGKREWLFFAIWAVIGWFITACAVSLGAPFWFDMLNKFVVVRSTVKPHEKSQEEKSKN